MHGLTRTGTDVSGIPHLSANRQMPKFSAKLAFSSANLRLVPQVTSPIFLGWRGHPAPRLRRRPRRGATRSRTPTRRTRPRWRRTSMPRREIMRREARERLFFVSSSESRTTIQVNCELDLKSTANLTSSQVATSLQVKLGLHFYRHSDFTSSERERPLWGCFWGAWRGTCLEVVIGESVHKDRPCGRAER